MLPYYSAELFLLWSLLGKRACRKQVLELFRLKLCVVISRTPLSLFFLLSVVWYHLRLLAVVAAQRPEIETGVVNSQPQFK